MPQRAPLGGLSAARFLRDHWQKKPLLVRGAFPAFVDPVSPEELAGLACEDGVESRIVRSRPRWEVLWGPHPERRFREMPERAWTVLVQEVNRWVPDAARLLDAFAFLPSVRVDDVMVSYAAPGGSVGPHLDSYDVFLVQGRGRRRWRYDTKKTRDVRFRKGLALRVLERFTPDADAVLEPGDMLYLPPGFAHHGVAVTPCLTYSIGFRSPALRELRLAFATASPDQGLLEDPPFAPAENPGAIPDALLARVREVVRRETSDEEIDRWFASFATRLKPGHDIPKPRAVVAERILAGLARDATVVRSEDGRWAYLPHGRGLYLYVGGQEIAVASAAKTAVLLLCASRRIAGRDLAKTLRSEAARALIVRLFALGALRFDRS